MSENTDGSVLLGQQLSDQLLRLVSFDLQFVRSLSDQIFQICTVLLQHTEHGVNDVCLLPFVYDPELTNTQSFTAENTGENIAVPQLAQQMAISPV